MVRRKLLTVGLALGIWAALPGQAWADSLEAGPGEKIRNYGVAHEGEWIPVRTEPSETAETVGGIPESGICYIREEENGWCEIISGEVTGYVPRESLYREEEAWKLVHEIGEENFPVGQPLEQGDASGSFQEALAATAPAENLTGSQLRQQIVEFACQFEGNPYVWGGTSLTEGADCSGFVQTVFAQYGISLPRVSGEQAQTGTRIPVAEAQAGDLIFYSRNGKVYHVVLCIGDGKAIHANDSSTGIIISDIPQKNACWAVSLI